MRNEFDTVQYNLSNIYTVTLRIRYQMRECFFKSR